MKKKIFLLGWVIVIGAGAYYFYLQTRTPSLVRVAIIDTGVKKNLANDRKEIFFYSNAAEIPGNEKDDDGNGYTDDVSGWNFFHQTPSVEDSEGHGTLVAESLVRSYEHVEILPLKIAESKFGMTPAALTQAIRYAIEAKSKVINISFGMRHSSRDLESIVKEASSKGIVIVAAAGVGIPNPFRPISVDQVYPQAFDDVIVVGMVRTPSNADRLSNFGSLIDVVTIDDGKGEFGSSFAAASISGAVARKLAKEPTMTLKAVRAWLRSNTKRPIQPFDDTRFGFGIVEPENLTSGGTGERVSLRLFPSQEEGAWEALLSAENSIKSGNGSVSCGGKSAVLAQSRFDAGKKGRASYYFQLKTPTLKECQITMTLELENSEGVVKATAPLVDDVE